MRVILEDIDNVIQHGGDDKTKRPVSIYSNYKLVSGLREITQVGMNIAKLFFIMS